MTKLLMVGVMAAGMALSKFWKVAEEPARPRKKDPARPSVVPPAWAAPKMHVPVRRPAAANRALHRCRRHP